MGDLRPIGVFDSGVGGLSVVAEIRRLLPRERILYYADAQNCPYGPRPPAEIRRLALDASRFLLSHSAKLIVVACNTASSVALADLRSTLDVPFVGMVPAIKPASLATRVRKVVVLATAATVEAEVFNELVAQFARGIEVHTQACPGLVDLVERCQIETKETLPLLDQYLAPVRDHGADAVVLGCTHFVFLRNTIQEMVGPAVRVIDTGEAVARQVQRLLKQYCLESGPDSEGGILLLSSGDRQTLVAAAGRLLGYEERG